MTSRPTLAAPAMFSSLSVRNYRLFAAGQIVSLTGTWMQMTTQDWLVLALGGGGTALGVTLALQFSPMLLLGLYAGVVVDRSDKRLLLLLTQSSSAVLALAMCVLVTTGAVNLPLVYVFATLVGTVAAVDTPARQAFVSEMVGPERLTNAVALNSVTFNSARVIGPAIAGTLIGTLGTMPGAAVVFGANAISFVAVLTGLLRMRTAELHPSRRAGRAAGQLRDGLRYVGRHRPILVPILLIGVVGAMGLNFPVTLALMASEEFDGTAQTYGLLSSVLAVGCVLGAGFGARRHGPPRPAVLFVGAGAFGVFEAASALAPNLWTFALVTTATGAAMLFYTTATNAAVQLASDPAVRGRVMSVYLLVFLGTTPLGAPVVGWVCEVAGPRAGLALGGLASLFAAVGAAVAYGPARRTPPSVPQIHSPSAALKGCGFSREEASGAPGDTDQVHQSSTQPP